MGNCVRLGIAAAYIARPMPCGREIEMSQNKAVLVVGAGDSTGGAIARRFAREGYVACVTRRNAEKLAPLLDRIRADGSIAQGFGSDARKEEEVVALVQKIERDIAPIEAAVFNVGANVRFGVAETTERVYRKVWEMGALAGFLFGREVVKAMVPRGRGTIMFTGATSSLCAAAALAQRGTDFGQDPASDSGPHLQLAAILARSGWKLSKPMWRSSVPAVPA